MVKRKTKEKKGNIREKEEGKREGETEGNERVTMIKVHYIYM